VSWLLITQYKSFHPPSANLRKIHIFSFLTVSFHQMGKREQKLRLAMGRKEEVETQEKI